MPHPDKKVRFMLCFKRAPPEAHPDYAAIDTKDAERTLV